MLKTVTFELKSAEGRKADNIGYFAYNCQGGTCNFRPAELVVVRTRKTALRDEFVSFMLFGIYLLIRGCMRGGSDTCVLERHR